MNTVTDLEDLQKLVKSSHIADRITKLTLYDLEWQKFNSINQFKEELSYQGISRKVIQRIKDGRLKRDNALYNYAEFLKKENEKDSDWKVNKITHALLSLQNLDTLVVSHAGHWWDYPPTLQKYSKLKKSIWIAPLGGFYITRSLRTVISALSNCHSNYRIRNLKLVGDWKTGSCLRTVSPKLPRIEKLYIDRSNIYESEDVYSVRGSVRYIVE